MPHQLVTTVGPSSFGQEAELAAAGATTIRLNASHLSVDDVFAHATRILAATRDVDCIIDLQGAKMRLSTIDPTPVTTGQVVSFCCDPTDTTALYVPHPELFEQVAKGEVISLDDRRLSLLVTERSQQRLCARASHDYVIKSRKGINCQNHPIEFDDLGPTDRAILAQCATLERVRYAISFVKDGTEAKWVRSRVALAKVTLKVERQEALDTLELLAASADELWICRGDLGAQLGLERLGRAIAKLDPLDFSLPVLMAGQVFEHLTYHDDPTRSEICHVFDLLSRGYAGVVLSDETAIGQKPTLATAWARRLLDSHTP
jgi:pyruvate kinase